MSKRLILVCLAELLVVSGQTDRSGAVRRRDLDGFLMVAVEVSQLAVGSRTCTRLKGIRTSSVSGALTPLYVKVSVSP